MTPNQFMISNSNDPSIGFALQGTVVDASIRLTPAQLQQVSDQYLTFRPEEQPLHAKDQRVVDTKIHEATHALLQKMGVSHEILWSSGGSLANSAKAAAKFGAQCVLAGMTGNDSYSQLYRQILGNQGINTDFLTQQEGKGCVCTALLTDDRCMLTDWGTVGMLPYHPTDDFYRDQKLVAVESYLAQVPGVPSRVLYDATRKHIPTVFGAGSVQNVQKSDYLKLLQEKTITYFFATEEELLQLTHMDTLQQAAKSVGQYVSTVFATRGVNGVGVYTSGSFTSSSVQDLVPPDQVVDKLGAGDYFQGGVMAGIVKEFSLEDSVHFGGLCAAQIIRTQGTDLQKEQVKLLRKKFEEFKPSR